jgi:hypothetical protein
MPFAGFSGIIFGESPENITGHSPKLSLKVCKGDIHDTKSQGEKGDFSQDLKLDAPIPCI